MAVSSNPAPAAGPGRLRRNAAVALKLLLSAGIVAFLIARLDWPGVASAWERVEPGLLAVALVALVPIPLIAALRWRLLAAAVDVALPGAFFVRATYAALFAGQVLPSGVGVDAVRIGLLWREQVPLGRALLSVGLDRGCGVAGIALLALGGLPFALARLPQSVAAPAAAAAVSLVVAGLLVLLVARFPWPAPRPGSGPVARVLRLLHVLRGVLWRPALWLALGLSAALHLSAIVSVQAILHAFGAAPRFADLVTVVALALFAGMLPVSFNGWGVREGAMVAGLALLAVPVEVALTASLLFGVGSFVCALPGSITWLRLRGRAASPA